MAMPPSQFPFFPFPAPTHIHGYSYPSPFPYPAYAPGPVFPPPPCGFGVPAPGFFPTPAYAPSTFPSTATYPKPPPPSAYMTATAPAYDPSALLSTTTSSPDFPAAVTSPYSPDFSAPESPSYHYAAAYPPPLPGFVTAPAYPYAATYPHPPDPIHLPYSQLHAPSATQSPPSASATNLLPPAANNFSSVAPLLVLPDHESSSPAHHISFDHSTVQEAPQPDTVHPAPNREHRPPHSHASSTSSGKSGGACHPALPNFTCLGRDLTKRNSTSSSETFSMVNTSYNHRFFMEKEAAVQAVADECVPAKDANPNRRQREFLNIQARLDQQQARERTSLDTIKGELAKLTAMASQLAVSLGKHSTSADASVVCDSSASSTDTAGNTSSSRVSSAPSTSPSTATGYAALHMFDEMPTSPAGYDHYCSGHQTPAKFSCVQEGSTNFSERNMFGEMPQSYGLHNLERQTVILADGTERSYFTLPADYPLEQANPPMSPSAADNMGVMAQQSGAPQAAGLVPGLCSNDNNATGSHMMLVPNHQAINVQDASHVFKETPVPHIYENSACLSITTDLRDFTLKLQQQDDGMAGNCPVKEVSNSYATTSSKLNIEHSVRELRLMWDPGDTTLHILLTVDSGAIKLWCTDIYWLQIIARRVGASRVIIFESVVMCYLASGLRWMEANAAAIHVLAAPHSEVTPLAKYFLSLLSQDTQEQEQLLKENEQTFTYCSKASKHVLICQHPLMSTTITATVQFQAIERKTVYDAYNEEGNACLNSVDAVLVLNSEQQKSEEKQQEGDHSSKCFYKASEKACQEQIPVLKHPSDLVLHIGWLPMIISEKYVTKLSVGDTSLAIQQAQLNKNHTQQWHMLLITKGIQDLDPGIGKPSSLYLWLQGLTARISTEKPLSWLPTPELTKRQRQVTSASYIWDPGTMLLQYKFTEDNTNCHKDIKCYGVALWLIHFQPP